MVAISATESFYAIVADTDTSSCTREDMGVKV